MTLEDAKKLFELQEEEGYSVMIQKSGYVDSFAYITESDGKYTYSSEVFSGRSLSEVNLEDVEVYRHATEWDEYLEKKEYQET